MEPKGEPNLEDRPSKKKHEKVVISRVQKCLLNEVQNNYSFDVLEAPDPDGAKWVPKGGKWVGQGAQKPKI